MQDRCPEFLASGKAKPQTELRTYGKMVLSIVLTALPQGKNHWKVLYRAYIDAFKANLRAQLENIEIIDDDTQEVEKIEEEVEALEETLQESENRLN